MLAVLTTLRLDDEATESLAFLGRLHPLFVHLPIGMLAALLLVELVAGRRAEGRVVTVRRLLWVATALGAFLTTFSGWTEAEHTQAAGDVVFRHRWFAVALMAVVILTAACDVFGRTARAAGLRRVGLLVSLVLVALTGHNGGVLTHGRDHLSEKAPSWLYPLVGAPGTDAVAPAATGTLFAALEEHCSACHGPDQQKAGLRLDTREGLESVIEAGDPAYSELFRRVALPPDHDEVMPPDGGFPEAATIELLEWIRAGAPMDAAEDNEEQVRAERAATEAELLAVEAATGGRVRATDGDGLEVTFAYADAPPTAAQLAALAPVADRVVDLSFAGLATDGAAFEGLPELPALTHLRLERTDVDDTALELVAARAPRLTWVNVHSTRVATDDWTAMLGALETVVAYGAPLGDREPVAGPDLGDPLRVQGAEGLAAPFANGGPRRVLAADASKGRIALLQETALQHFDVLWEHEIAQLHDLQWLDGRVLFQESWTRLIEVDVRTGATAWTYDAVEQSTFPDAGPIEVHAFRRLPNGLTLVALSGARRLVEVDAEGAVVQALALQVDDPHPHHDTRSVRKTDAGTYLVAHERDGVVREYDSSGKVVWQYDVPTFDREPAAGHGFDAWGDQCFAAERLPNGNTLITTGNGHALLEVTPAGELARHIGQDDLDGVRLAWTTTVQRLTNGNLVLTNCHAGPDQPQLVEIDPDGKVVWTFRDHERFGDGLSNAWIVEDPERSGAREAREGR